MNLALDYDKTYTEDPEFWREVILLARKYGHKTRIVTMRHDTLDKIPEEEELVFNYETGIVYCDGRSKRKVTEGLGIKIDVWIDDWPEGIPNDSIYTPIQLVEWREAQKKLA